ncbi:hypothetical protein [Antrihabitans cavernicola]|uniref:hypothetical protein n=1 Tax=Antrihabitans cavernicola TaxID=2495913 RepID=UPI0016595BC7|nr:hypothetical protein [Spelaeibacter cavernicola]
MVYWHVGVRHPGETGVAQIWAQHEMAGHDAESVGGIAYLRGHEFGPVSQSLSASMLSSFDVLAAACLADTASAEVLAVLHSPTMRRGSR